LTKVSVAFICDSHYVVSTAVAITSLICNKNPDTYYNIYIIAAGLSEREIKKFYKFRGSETNIHIIKICLKKFNDIKECGHVNSTACLKFDLPDLIPDQDKVLYLDSDVIIQKDLSDLFDTNIIDYYAGVVKDIGMVENNLHIENYFNSGVMLLNLKLMRENDTSTALLNIRRSSDNLTYMDQDCFNILFDKQIKILPLIYNCFYNFFLMLEDKYTLEYINKCFGTNYLSLNNIKRDSYIIHLAGYDKPWIYFDNVLVREWDAYFKKSPFKLHKLKRKSIIPLEPKQKYIKPREFIASHNWTNLSYVFFKYWRDKGFNFTMGKVKKRLFNDKKE
jgi:lipopolysaccharide biosynthesis glycosyltransferase